MPSHLLRDFHAAAVLQARRDACGSKRVIANLCFDTRSRRAANHAIGIRLRHQLLPHIRNWKDQHLVRSASEARYEHIDELFTAQVDWKLNYPRLEAEGFTYCRLEIDCHRRSVHPLVPRCTRESFRQ